MSAATAANTIASATKRLTCFRQSVQALTARCPTARLAALQGEIARLVDAVAQAGLSDALRARLAAAEAERTALEQRARNSAATPVPTAAEVISGYKRRLLQLQQALESDADRQRTRELLAELLGPVTLTRDAEGDWAEMEEPAARVALAGSTTPLTVVAGARISSCRRIPIRRRQGLARG